MLQLNKIEQMQLAISDGVEVFGFCPWSAYIKELANATVFEAFDLLDRRCIRKDSFYWYQKVIKTNGQDL